MYVVFSGLLTLIVAVILGVFAVYLGFYIFQRFNPKIDEPAELENNNIAVAILNGAFILALGLLLKTVLQPMIQTFFYAITRPEGDLKGMLLHGGLMMVQFASALLVSIVALFLGLRIFAWLNRRIDEFAEIKNNNIAVAILTGAIIITLALFIQDGLGQFLQTIIPTPSIQNDGLSPFG